MSDAKTYTEEQVSEAVNGAMDMLIGELPWLDTEDEDLLALMVNAAMSSLKTGGKATFKDVIRANFEVTVDEFLTERGW